MYKKYVNKYPCYVICPWLGTKVINGPWPGSVLFASKVSTGVHFSFLFETHLFCRLNGGPRKKEV